MGSVRLLNMMETDEKAHWERMEDIYTDAFPECERKPFSLIREKMVTGLVDMLAFMQDGEVTGLAVTMKHDGLVLLDYFAVDSSRRGRGCGSRALQLVQEYFRDQKFFLEIESLKEQAPNMDQRRKRKAFFLKNGMGETGMYAEVSGTRYEILSRNGPLSFEEYASVYERAYGNDSCRTVKRIE